MGMSIDTIWYMLVALVLSNSNVLTKIQDNQVIMNRITGVNIQNWPLNVFSEKLEEDENWGMY